MMMRLLLHRVLTAAVLARKQQQKQQQQCTAATSSLAAAAAHSRREGTVLYRRLNYGCPSYSSTGLALKGFPLMLQMENPTPGQPSPQPPLLLPLLWSALQRPTMGTYRRQWGLLQGPTTTTHTISTTTPSSTSSSSSTWVSVAAGVG
jgi:hypothetical protein